MSVQSTTSALAMKRKVFEAGAVAATEDVNAQLRTMRLVANALISKVAEYQALFARLSELEEKLRNVHVEAEALGKKVIELKKNAYLK